MDTNNGCGSNQLIRIHWSIQIPIRNPGQQEGMVPELSWHQMVIKYSEDKVPDPQAKTNTLFEQIFAWRKNDIEKFVYTPYVTYMRNTTSKDFFLTTVL